MGGNAEADRHGCGGLLSRGNVDRVSGGKLRRVGNEAQFAEADTAALEARVRELQEAGQALTAQRDSDAAAASTIASCLW